MTAHHVDLVIAVHNERRPVARAVRSALAASERVRVSVVCHDVDPALIARELGALTSHERVRLLTHRDGVRSPSGPFNAGLDAADAEWVSIMGSDDELEPGAIDAWLATAERTGADVVLPTIVRRGGRDIVVATPPSRPGRGQKLDGLRDRLAYRSAPLGLLRRTAIGELRFGDGIATGEDVLFSAQLYFSGLSVARDRGPAYLVHDDADDRVTLSPTTVREALGFVDEVLDSRWFRAQPLAVRTALAVKTLRVNVLGQFVTRVGPEHWTTDERGELMAIIRAIESAAPGAIERLSRADRALLDAADPGSGADAARVLSLAARRRRYGTPVTLVPRRVSRALDREAPLRMMVASWATVRADARIRRRAGASA